MSRLRRSARQIAAEQMGRKRSVNQLWLTVGVALIALVAILLFRQSCARRMGKFYESLNPPSSRETSSNRNRPAGAAGSARPEPGADSARPPGESGPR